MSLFADRIGLPKFVFLAFGVSAKLMAALALLAVLQNYFALDIRISHTRPMIAVQLIVRDNLPHMSIAGLLKYAGDFLSQRS